MANLRSRIPARVFLPIIFLVTLPLIGCHDNRPRVEGDIYGRVQTIDMNQLSGASVYLGRRLDYFSSAAVMIVDSTLTDESGYYLFPDTKDGSYRVYAGVWQRGGLDFAAVSPFDPLNEYTDLDQPFKSSSPQRNLTVHDIQSESVVTGKTLFFNGTGVVPCDSAEVTLDRYRGAQFVAEGLALSDASGDYAILTVQTGNYIVHAVKTLRNESPYLYYIAAESAPFFCDGNHPVTAPDLNLTDVAVEKPAIYIYPARPGPHHVRLNLDGMVHMTRSIPAYGEGWDVSIDRRGRIDGQYDYLFYEMSLQGAPLIREGWCLDGHNVKNGLERIVRQFGLNEGESRDFLDYWLRRLPPAPWLVVKPVTGENLEHLVQLRCEPAPDSVLRFWLLFSGSQQFVELDSPDVQPLVRRGGVLVEWGGALVPRLR